MKKLLITTMLSVMLITPVMASAYTADKIEKICKGDSVIAGVVMTERQNGIARIVLTERLKNYFNNDRTAMIVVFEMINKAYLHPIYHGDQNKTDIINMFGRQFYYECLQSMYSN